MLYFIDPVWLSDLLAKVITVPEGHSFIKNGSLADSDIPFLFKDTVRFPPQYTDQYLQLLEKFEIALSLGDGTRLFPSMLPADAPLIRMESSAESGITGETLIYSHTNDHIYRPNYVYKNSYVCNLNS